MTQANQNGSTPSVHPDCYGAMPDDELMRRAEAGETIGSGSRQIELLVKRVKLLEAFAVDIRDNYDCDSDAHKYGTPCRCCEAEYVLTAT